MLGRTHPQFSIDPIPDPRTGRVFGPCPKCQSVDPYVDYHRPLDIQKTWRAHGIDCDYHELCMTHPKQAEHFFVQCNRCHYTWQEDVNPIGQ
jgi:hypothetical protein